MMWQVNVPIQWYSTFRWHQLDVAQGQSTRWIRPCEPGSGSTPPPKAPHCLPQPRTASHSSAPPHGALSCRIGAHIVPIQLCVFRLGYLCMHIQGAIWPVGLPTELSLAAGEQQLLPLLPPPPNVHFCEDSCFQLCFNKSICPGHPFPWNANFAQVYLFLRILLVDTFVLYHDPEKLS